MSDSVLVVAAEASSALYARRLLEEWNHRGRKVQAFGVGNAAMEKLGFDIVGRSESMAVVGFKEVLKHYKDIRKVFYDLIEECKKRRPKFALLLDYPDFNLRLAKELKKLDIQVIYYISPQVWAWRTSRVKQIQKCVDHILVLLPFEKSFYEKHGVAVEFVGHPLLDEIAEFRNSDWNRELERQRRGLAPEDFVLGLMPGSRRSEIENHLKLQIQVSEELSRRFPFVKVLLLVAESLDADYVRSQLSDLQSPLQVVQDQPEKMISTCDFVLAKSGTGTLLVSLLGRPSVVMYRMSAFSAWMAKTFVKGVRYFSLTNLVLDRPLVPEYFQEAANQQNLVEKISEYILDPQKLQKYQQELQEVQSVLGQQGATVRVANALEKFFDGPNF